MSATGKWYLTEHAVECFAHVLRDSRRDRSRAADTSPEYASRRLQDLVATATYRETDTSGREIWRSPPSAYGLRWVVSKARRPEGPLPQVIWVGQGKPPERVWGPPATAPAAPVPAPPRPQQGAGRPAADPEDPATINRTWRARRSDVERLDRLAQALEEEGEDSSQGAIIRLALERLEESMLTPRKPRR